jgi:hypothetical protein
MELSDWKAAVLQRFPEAEFKEQRNGVTARSGDANCGWWIAPKFDWTGPKCWIAPTCPHTPL